MNFENKQHIQVHDFVIGRHRDYLNRHGVVVDFRMNRRGPEYLVSWDDGDEEFWCPGKDLWLDQTKLVEAVLSDSSEQSVDEIDSDEDNAAMDEEAERIENQGEQRIMRGILDNGNADDQPGLEPAAEVPIRPPKKGRKGNTAQTARPLIAAARKKRPRKKISQAEGPEVLDDTGAEGVAVAEAAFDPKQLLKVRISRADVVPEVFQEWTETADVLEDQSREKLYSLNTIIKWTGVLGHDEKLYEPGPRSPVEYFTMFFPMQHLKIILDSSNEMLRRADRENFVLDASGFMQFQGIRLAMALNPRPGGVESYWCTDNGGTTVIQPINFQTLYGLSLNWFKRINENFRVASQEDLNSDDPYGPIDSVIGAFNKRRQDVITPGRVIVVDECMCSWKGIESVFAHESFARVMKIRRKPKGVGFEFKASADGETGVLLHIELQKGKERQNDRQFEGGQDGGFLYHCAIVLRCVFNYFGTSRIIVADAAFGSVLTATALLAHGLYFLGIVKTCTKAFPVEWFKNWASEDPIRGTHKVATTTVNVSNVENEPVLRKVTALGWCCKKDMVKTFVGTCSTTNNAAEKHFVPRTKLEKVDNIWQRKTVMKGTDRPQMVADLYEHFGNIDLHDRYRQGYLGLEMSWKTECWWHRVYATLLGMCVTDAYLAYKYECEMYQKMLLPDIEMMDFYRFADLVSYALIHKRFGFEEHHLRHNRNFLEQHNALRQNHTAIPLSETRKYQSMIAIANIDGSYTNFQIRCHRKGCHGKVTKFCSACSDPEHDKFFGYCDHFCFADHVLHIRPSSQGL